uniref:Acyl-CoA oxidase C-alpha1 domain-containing protein n=1 Tax=Lactuca sativa TaxID=4236 RepID=A0A9R1VT23_LACSA|nr:hypothetical protein LSAT_V11C400167740 [Lactuca sativa]
MELSMGDFLRRDLKVNCGDLLLLKLLVFLIILYRLSLDNLRIPRENLLNSVANVSPDGQYLSAIKDPDQRFAAFMAPLTTSRIPIAVVAMNATKIGLAITIRYSLTRRAFSIRPNEPEVLLLDYPSHQRRLIPLIAKTSLIGYYLKSNQLKQFMLFLVHSSLFQPDIAYEPFRSTNAHDVVVVVVVVATTTTTTTTTIIECREACGGQGINTENHVGHLKSEYDVQLTFKGDNNVLMQQVSKALLVEILAGKKRNKPIKGLGLEHLKNLLQLSLLTLQALPSEPIDIFCLRLRDLLQRFVTKMYQLAEDVGRAFADRLVIQTFVDVEATVLQTFVDEEM